MPIHRKSFILFVTLAVAVLTLLGGISWFAWHLQYDRQLDAMTRQEDHLLDVQAQNIENDLKQLVYSLKFLADQVYLHQPYKDAEELARFQEDMLSFINTGELFDQVRLLDKHGMEIARVNYAAGSPEMVAEDQMQDKGKRYYFKDTIRLKQGELYVSPLDLNMEQGKVSLPIKPTMRLGMPVFDYEDHKVGIVILNYLAEHMLSRFRQAAALSQSEQSLLNEDGYWLSHADSSKAWGFMFDNRKDQRMDNIDPAIWQQMNDSDSGIIHRHGNVYTFVRFRPLTGVQSITGIRVAPTSAVLQWYALSTIPKQQLASVAAAISRNVMLWSLPLALLMLVACWLLTLSIQRRRQADLSLAHSEERYRMVAQSAGDAIVVADADGYITAWNRAAGVIFGYDEAEIIGQPVAVLMPTDYRDTHEKGVQRFVATGEAHLMGKPLELEALRKDASRFPVELTLGSWENDHGPAFSAIIRDISGRKKAEQALLAASRMQATETLAGGISHLINNQMTAVIGNASLLEMKLSDQIGYSGKLKRIAESARQASGLADGLLAFARGGSGITRRLNLNSMIRQVLEKNRQTAPAHIKIQWGLAHDLQAIECVPEMIEQVLLALWDNACEAMPNGGCINTHSINSSMDDAAVRRYPGLKAGHYVRLTLADTGFGMSKDTLDKIFEPFFSTKFQGRGLGLAAAYGIVKQNGGYIYADSRPGEGTTFELFFSPATGSTPDHEEENQHSGEMPTGNETILMVDDDPGVAEINEEILVSLGYSVLTAAHGKEAVDIASSYAGDIHLCMLDLDMPIMSGSEAFPLLMQIRPDMKVLICSGYKHDEHVQRLIDAGASGFLQKPYFPEQLAVSLRSHLL